MILPSRPLAPWKGPLPAARGGLRASLILPVPLDQSTSISTEETLRYLGSLRRFMTGKFDRSYEILLVPFGERSPAFGPFLDHLARAPLDRRVFRWIGGSHAGPGSAVREGVFLSRGRVILVGNLECLYDPDFYGKALDLLGPDNRGVMANRRLPDSEFTVPVTALSLLYRRHLLGVILGRIWSLLFKLPLTDNLSGAYVLERGFALRVFNRLTCPGFLYEAELALVAKANGHHLADLPASFFLEREKPRLRVYREIGSVLRWTWRFLVGLRRGDYGFLRPNGNLLTADDWGMSPAINDGILEMARSGNLRRVSVLAGGRFLDYRLAELKRIPGIEFGLHFNLTQPESGAPFGSLPALLFAWFWSRWFGRGKMDRTVRRLLEEQIASLARKGIRPIRLEGHHHVHALPGLLEVVHDILKTHGIQLIRLPDHPDLGAGPRTLITWWGRSLRKKAGRFGLQGPPFYYPGPSDLSSLNRLIGALNHVHHSEVLFHPAIRDDIGWAAPSDHYREQRVREYQLLRLLSLETGLEERR